MHVFMTGQWFHQRSRIAPPRPTGVLAGADLPPTAGRGSLRALPGAASADGACCPRPRLQAEPGYPYTADWRLRCRACGRLRAAEEARREPIPAAVRAAFGAADALRAAS
jgi:hypothetical protein